MYCQENSQVFHMVFVSFDMTLIVLFSLAALSGLYLLYPLKMHSWWQTLPFISLAGLLVWRLFDPFLLITCALLGCLALEDVEKQAAHTDLLVVPIAWLLWTQSDWSFVVQSLLLVVFSSYLVYRQVLGSGDVMVCLFMSLVLSLNEFAYVLLIASLSATIWLSYVRASRVAFLPFLVASYIIILCWTHS
jgi:hypothetical protein